MPAPPLRTALANTYPNPTNAVARAGFGALWDYVTTLLGATGNASDARTALGALAKAGDTLTGALNEAHGADVASAGTVNLSAATGNLVDVTGTTTVTAITLADGASRTVRFTGVLTLTHGASLVLPGAANITTAAGDFAVFRGYASGVVRCVSYHRAAGTALVAPGAATETTSGIVELATNAEAVAGTDTARAVTPAGVAAALASGSGLGSGQTWQDVTSTRALDTNYTNSTGRPIFVSVHVGQSGNSGGEIVVDSLSVGVGYSSASNAHFQLTAVVPDGEVYRVNTYTASTIVSWSELR